MPGGLRWRHDGLLLRAFSSSPRAPRKPADARASRSPVHAVVGCACGCRAAAGRPGADAGARSRRAMDERSKGALTKAARAADFTGKAKTAIEVLAPPGIDAPRVILMGTGRSPKELDRLLLGGFAYAQISARKGEAGDAGGGARRPRRGERGGIRRGPGAGRAAQELQLPQVPHAQERGERRGGEGARRFAQARRAVRQAGRRRQGIRGPQGRGGRRVPRPRPRQRAGQRAGPRRVRRAHARAVRRRPRGRDLRRGSDARPQDGIVPGRGAGQRASLAHGGAAVARRQVQARQDAVLRRQGRVLRHRRHLHEARRRHGGHEGRHGRRRLRRGPDAGARHAQGRRQRRRPHRPHREHAVGESAAPRRHRHQHVRPDHRGHQHRRGRAPRAGRRALVRAAAASSRASSSTWRR